MNNIKIYQLLNDVKNALRAEIYSKSQIDFDNHASNATLISENTDGSFDLADMVEELNEAVLELGEIVETLSEGGN